MMRALHDTIAEVGHGELPGANRLFSDYVERFDGVRDFYPWDPRDEAAPGHQAVALDRRAHPRALLSRVLAEQNAGWGADPAALRNAERLGDPRTLAVLTGQQTGLFGGPALTLYKAATAVGAAATFEAQLGRPVIPLFWMASEDHDLPEADHAILLDPEHRPATVRLPREGNPGFIPANLGLGDAAQRIVDEAEALLPETEFTGEVVAALRRAYRPEETLASAFARWLAFLTQGWGLVLLDPADPRLKGLARSVLHGELERAPTTSQAILEVSARLQARGYHPQITARADGANVFLLQDGRWPIRRAGRDLAVQRGNDVIPLDPTAVEPAALSPNVALRPVAQDSLLPTLAYIGGPAEVAYFAQLAPVYAAFEVPVPLLLPRASLTLVEGRIEELMVRHDLTLPQLRAEPEALVSAILRQDQAAAFEARMGEAKAALARTFKEVESLVGEIDPTLKGPAAQAAGHANHQLDTLEKKAIQALKRRHESLRAQIRRVREHLMPGGRPQERVLCLLPFLARHGRGLLEAVRAAGAEPGWTHRLVRLGPSRVRRS